MAKKSKGEKIDLLYTKPRDTKKNIASKNKKNSKNTRKLPKKKTINLDNEIIIGLTPKNDTVKKRKKSIKKSVNNKRKNTKQTKVIKQKKKQEVKKKAGLKTKVIRWTILILLILTAIILFLLSSVFNIKEIVVTNNSKISTEEIITLSELTANDNIFKVLKKSIRNKIKQNPYIEDVTIKKKLDRTVCIEIEERQTTYMLQYEGYYVYINNQGYILEISDVKPETPTIIGYETCMDNIKAGDRLVVEDLQKLDTVIKIMETAKDKEISNLITFIDITNKNEFILRLEGKGKTVHFGDNTNINEKVLWIVKLLEKEEGVEGDMYIENIHKAYFLEKV